MRLSRIISLLLVMFFMLGLCSCNNEETPQRKYPKKTLNVYNWGEYISDEDDEESGLIDVISGFELHFNTTLADKYQYYIEVNYSTYATNEDMYAKITNSAVAYDIIIPSDYMIQKMIAEELLNEIDFDKLTNYDNISDEFKNTPYDPENKYSVPYTYGMLGVIYNSEFVAEEDVADKSWGLLWNEKYAGKILQFNNPRDAFGTAMYWKNLDINSKDPAVWDQALELLKQQKPLLQGYVNDEIFNKMKGASAHIAPYFAGDFLTMAAENDDLDFYYPTEGTNYFVDAMCIPKNAKNEDAAHEFINYMLSLEAARANALYIGYASPNKAVKDDPTYIDLLSKEYDTERISAYDILYEKEPGRDPGQVNENYSYNPSYESFYRDENIDIQVHVNTLWESLKTENSTEPWIHFTSGAIIISVISLAVYHSYIKKKRSRDYRLRDKQKTKSQTN